MCRQIHSIFGLVAHFRRVGLDHINLIRRLPIKLALRGGPRDLALQLGLIGYYTKLTQSVVRGPRALQ